MAKVYEVKTGPGQPALFVSKDRTKANEYASKLQKEGKAAIVVLNPFGTIPDSEKKVAKPKVEKPKKRVVKPKKAPKAKELDDYEKTVISVFRQIGKDVINDVMFNMTVVVNNRWMPTKQSEEVLKKAIERNIVTRRNKDYLVLDEKYLTAEVPVGYKPSAEFIKSLIPEGRKPAPKDDMRDYIRKLLEKGPFELECEYNANPDRYPFGDGERVWLTECTEKYVLLQKADGSTYKHTSYIFFDEFLLKKDYHHQFCLNTAGGVRVRFRTVETQRELEADTMRKIPERKKEVHGPKQMVNHPKRMELHPERYYPINEDMAKAAKESYSFNDYRMGSTTASYKESVDEVYALAQEIKSQVPVSRHEEIDRLCDRYAKKYADWINRRNSNEASYPSVMIAGPANYDWKKRDRMVDREGKLWEEYEYIKAIPDKIRNMPNAGISSDDPNAIELIEKKIQDLEYVQTLMKEANTYYRKNKSLKGFPRISEINSSKDIDFYELKGAPFPSWALSNNNANIKRYRDRLETLKKNAERETTTSECEYFDIRRDAKKNRIMLFFVGVPDEKVRKILKHNGFRWSPTNKAWQCYYTRQGEWGLEQVIKELDKLSGKTVSQSRKRRRE